MQIEKDWVQEKLKELKTDIENQSDSLRKQQEFARVNEHLMNYNGADKVITSHEIHERLKIKPLKIDMTREEKYMICPGSK